MKMKFQPRKLENYGNPKGRIKVLFSVRLLNGQWLSVILYRSDSRKNTSKLLRRFIKARHEVSKLKCSQYLFPDCPVNLRWICQHNCEVIIFGDDDIHPLKTFRYPVPYLQSIIDTVN